VTKSDELKLCPSCIELQEMMDSIKPSEVQEQVAYWISQADLMGLTEEVRDKALFLIGMGILYANEKVVQLPKQAHSNTRHTPATPEALEAFERLVTGKGYAHGRATGGGDWPYSRKTDIETIRRALKELI